MRRSRFAIAFETNDELLARSSVRDALSFDLHSPDSSDELSLAEWRLAGVDLIAGLLGFTPPIFVAAYFLLARDGPSSITLGNPLIPSVLVVALDFAACAAMLMRRRFDFAPHAVIRGLCVYVALSGLLWTWFGEAVQDDAFILPIAAAQIILCAGISMGTIVSISS